MLRKDVGAASVDLWSFSNGQPRRFADSLWEVSSLAFRPDGAVLAAGQLEEAEVSRYTSALFGGLNVWRVSDAAPLVADTTRERPISQLLFTPSGRLLALRNDPIPSRRNCPYVACGEDENTDYRVSLLQVNTQTGAEVRLMQPGKMSTSTSSRFSIAPPGDALLVREQLGGRLIKIPSGERLAWFRHSALDSIYSEEPGGPEWSFNEDGSRVIVRGESTIGVALRRSRRILQLQNIDIGFSFDATQRIVAARAIRGDSDGVAFVVVRGDEPGSTLRRLDARTGAMQTMARFDDVVDDMLFIGDGRFWVRSSGVIQLHDGDGKLVASILQGARGDWLVTTPDGLYDAGGNGTRLAAWRTGERLESIADLPAGFHVPRLLPRILSGEHIAIP